MKKQLKLNNEIGVDLEKLIEGGMVILANSGGGKSYLIRRIAEQAVGHVQTIILDPEGEFASLREQFDFILAGKDADVPAEPRSAAMLAIKLLELNKSAIIDLYELHPQDRQRFVKLFCDALVNAPKHLYHPVLIILDEAHEYVPEGKPSEATWAVEALASKGRKRGQRLILASQRIAKISKNVTAEANNKLIGRASQDIDMKRAGDELGFGKDRLVELRQLKPGEFFAFGPAISDGIVKLKVGEVKTAHAKVGYTGKEKVPPPTDVIKKVLAELKDLPQEAEKEAKTMLELKQQLTEAKRKITTLERSPKTNVLQGFDQKFVDNAVKEAEKRKDQQMFELNNKYLEQVQNWFKTIEEIGKAMRNFKIEMPKKQVFQSKQIAMERPTIKKPIVVASPEIIQVIQTNGISVTFAKCAKLIASYLYTYNVEGGRSKTQVAVATGYSQNSGGFNNAISELSAAGYIKRANGKLIYSYAELPEKLQESVDLSLEKWLPKLGACSNKIWQLLLNGNSDVFWTKEQIAGDTGYSVSSGGFNNSLSELSALGLIQRVDGGIIINPEILRLQ